MHFGHPTSIGGRYTWTIILAVLHAMIIMTFQRVILVYRIAGIFRGYTLASFAASPFSVLGHTEEKIGGTKKERRK